MEIKDIIIKGAREHNLKNIDVTIPRNTLTVISGLSGSGKSSLAFDTLYSEGQRRYVESLSAYARQFLGLMEKPDVDSIEGLSPAIAIEQKSTGHNPRSTVGTITEINDYLRLLFSRAGTPTCYQCGKEIASQTVQEICDRILALPEKTKFQIVAPVVSARKGEYKDLLEKLQKDGYTRVRVDQKVYALDEPIPLDKNKKHSIEVVVDRMVAGADIKRRLTDSLETALKLSANSSVRIAIVDSEELVFSEKLSCTDCGISYDELSPRMFSFNNPFGACKECSGLGYLMEIDPVLVAPDPARSLAQGAIVPWNGANASGSWNRQIMISVCKHFDIPVDKPWSKLTQAQKNILLYGSRGEKVEINWRSHSGEGFAKFSKQF